MTYAAVKTPHRAAAAVALEHFVTLKRAMLPMNGNIAEHVPAIFAVIAELLAEVAAAGGRIVKPAQRADWGGVSGYFADPDGFLWEVAWNPKFPHV